MADGSLHPLIGDNDLPGFIQTTWYDLRFRNLNNMKIEKSSTLLIEQNNVSGLNFLSSNQTWDEAVAFPDLIFDRSQGKTFEFVFRTGDSFDGRIMMGIADAATEIEDLQNQAYAYADMALYMQDGNNSNKLFGRTETGDEWNELFDIDGQWKTETFYKVVMHVDPTQGLSSNLIIDEVLADDWSASVHNIVNHTSTNTANSSQLKPYFVINGSNDYSLAGVRIY